MSDGYPMEVIWSELNVTLHCVKTELPGEPQIHHHYHHHHVDSSFWGNGNDEKILLLFQIYLSVNCTGLIYSSSTWVENSGFLVDLLQNFARKFSFLMRVTNWIGKRLCAATFKHQSRQFVTNI